jgi:CDP-diacylglycerol--inositol 3-phosphatidyltransferase
MAQQMHPPSDEAQRPSPSSRSGDNGGDVTTAAQVLVYVPNLIGYSRIVLVLLSFGLLSASPERYWDVAVLCYICGFVGDLFDGYAARALHQITAFGGVLDMVTDRCSTLGLLTLLGCDSYYSGGVVDVGWLPAVPCFRLVAILLQILDVSSHWCQMYATLSLGMHHKSEEGNADKNFLVRWFYRYYWFFGYLCCGAEFTYVLLLIRSRLMLGSGGGIVVESLGTGAGAKLVPIVNSALLVTIPGCVAKQAVNVMQLLSACHAIASSDARRIQQQSFGCRKVD